MTNFEIKVKISGMSDMEQTLKKVGAVYQRDMHHTDYYFKMGDFKEKIREIDENEVQSISYKRIEIMGRKESKYDIKNITQEEKRTLLNQKKVLCVVDKVRKLWISKNTRIHLDKVLGLGCFLELETVIKNISAKKGRTEFKEVLELLKIDTKKAIPYSYSDLILENQKAQPSPIFINKFASI